MLELLEAFQNYIRPEGYELVDQPTSVLSQLHKGFIFRHREDSTRLIVKLGGTNRSYDEKTVPEIRLGKVKKKRVVTNRNLHPSEVHEDVVEKFYSLARMYGARQDGDNLALVFYDTEYFRRELDPLRPALERLGIAVYLVGENKAVTKF